MNLRHALPIIVCAGVLLTGCLTAEYKEYRIRLKNDHTGEATIRFRNIISESDDTSDVSADDFRQLVDSYLKGTRLEGDQPGFRNVRKRLFEEDGVLVGELTFSFDSLSVVRIFRYDRESPFMYFVGNPLSSEQLVETNGTYGRDWMPVVFWPKDASELYVKTRVVSEVAYHRDLLSYFREWQAGVSRQKKQ